MEGLRMRIARHIEDVSSNTGIPRIQSTLKRLQESKIAIEAEAFKALVELA